MVCYFLKKPTTVPRFGTGIHYLCAVNLNENNVTIQEFDARLVEMIEYGTECWNIIVVMDELNKIQIDYLKVFETIKPILDDMKSNWPLLYPEYLGWFDLGSKIIQNPDILFVGINPGPGRFRQWNYNKPKENYVIPSDYHTP